MMTARRSVYVHGTTPEEQQRLSTLNRLLNDSSLRELGLKGGERILDVGCGLAQYSRLMARAAGPNGCVLGIERDALQIAEASRQAEMENEASLIELRQGDAFDLPLRDPEWGTFDLAHARFLLEHVSEPLTVVQQMIRAVRPGGRIVLEDDDHEVMRLWPEPPGLELAWRAYMKSYAMNGNDPIVGRRLVELLHEAGAKPRRNTWIFFGACAGQPDFPDFVENLASILIGARAAILSTGFDVQALDQSIEAVREWGRREDASFWFARSWAEGVRPA